MQVWLQIQPNDIKEAIIITNYVCTYIHMHNIRMCNMYSMYIPAPTCTYIQYICTYVCALYTLTVYLLTVMVEVACTYVRTYILYVYVCTYVYEYYCIDVCTYVRTLPVHVVQTINTQFMNAVSRSQIHSYSNLWQSCVSL